MEPPVEISDNPGQENNDSTPTDERQSQQIGDMLMDKPPKKEETPEPDDVRDEDFDDFEPEGGEDEDRDRYGYERGERERTRASEEGDGDEETVPEPADEVTQLREQVSKMNETMQSLQQQLQQSQQPQEEPEPEAELPKIEVDPDEFLTEDELDEFSVDPASVLKKLAARIYTRAREDTLRDLPEVVGKAAQRQSALSEARQTFWNENKDLAQRAAENPRINQLIRLTANELHSENPSWDLNKLFRETGKEVRKTIGAAKDAEEIEKNTQTKNKNGSGQHGKPKSKRRGGKAPDNRTDKQKQLDAMAASVRR